MKFFSTFSKICLLGLLFVGVTHAATGDLRDWIDNLSAGTAFGYTSAQKISISQITTSKLIVSSPVIHDDLGNTIKRYTVMYSAYTIDEFIANTSLLDQSQEKTFDFTTLGSTITMELNAVTGSIDPTKVYYLYVVPKDQNNVMGGFSNEIRFQLSTQRTGEGLFVTGAVHASAGADMNLANVSCTTVLASRTVTCRRTAIDGSDKVDILLWDPNTEVFNKLATVNMSAERYDFTVSRNGEFLINFLPNNGGREKRYTHTVSGIGGTPATPHTTPAITHVPHVGPTENILVALFIAFVLYLLYRRSTLHRK